VRLCDRDAAHLLDLCEADRAIAARAGHDDAHGAFTVHLGHGAKEDVDGDMRHAAAIAALDAQMAVVHRQVHTGRDHIHVVGFHGHRVRDLKDAHRRGALQDVRRAALVAGRQVKDGDEGHARLGGHVFKEMDQRLETARGGTDPDDREVERAGRQSGAVGGRIGVGNGRGH